MKFGFLCIKEQWEKRTTESGALFCVFFCVCLCECLCVFFSCKTVLNFVVLLGLASTFIGISISIPGSVYAFNLPDFSYLHNEGIWFKQPPNSLLILTSDIPWIRSPYLILFLCHFAYILCFFFPQDIMALYAYTYMHNGKDNRHWFKIFCSINVMMYEDCGIFL